MVGSLTLFTLGANDVLLAADVFGSGIATWRFDVTPGGGTVVGGVTNQFASVPEPRTLLLFAVAVVGVAARKRWLISHR
jgi:hypothetical protein